MKNLLLSATLLIIGAATISAQTSREEVCANPDYAGGVYYAYPVPTEALTPAPKGYTPFYISHYARHGSRFLISDNDYLWVLRLLEKADSAKALTPLGTDVMRRIQAIWPMVKGRSGDLTSVGCRQHQGIAERMARNFPQVFKAGRHVSARSTMVHRCAMSMVAFGDALKGRAPGLDITYEMSQLYMDYLNYHTELSNRFTSWENGPWVAAYKAWEKSRLHPARLVKSLFSDETFVYDNVVPTDLMWGLYWIAVDMQDTDSEVRFYDVFKGDELFELWQCNNYRFYAGNANHPGSEGRTVANATHLLQNIITSADEAIKDGSISATLRFGHDGNVIPLLAILGIENYNVAEADHDALHTVWCDFRAAPMAANVQIVFYRNQKGDILVKFLHNEREVHIPVATDRFPYYRWSDVREYYVSGFAGVKKEK